MTRRLSKLRARWRSSSSCGYLSYVFFDVVMMIDVLHHTEDPAALLGEAQRVARQCILIKDHMRDGGCWHQEGFAYANYSGQTGNGISLSSPAWVCAQLQQFDRLRMVFYSETAWDDHQDVCACLHS